MPNSSEHRRFVKATGWEYIRTTDHDYYKKKLPNGEILYTKISNTRKEYKSRLFQNILKQLQCTKEEFQNPKKK